MTATMPEPYVRPDLYDLLFDSLDVDLDFYLGVARRAAGPVLDLACGTGRTMLPMLEAGIEAVGVDASEPMLERLRAKAAARGLAPALHRARMADFDLGRRFGAVIVPFNAFAHNLAADEQIATLRGCHRHLEPGGTLALDVISLPAERIARPGPRRRLEREVPHPETGLPVRLWNTQRLDVVAQVQHSRYDIEEVSRDGSTSVHRFESPMRWVSPAEMSLLLRLAGFGRHAIHGDFDRSPVTAAGDFVVVEARREDG